MKVFLQTGVARCPVHAIYGQSVYGACLDTLPAFLPCSKQAKLIGGYQWMIAQIQIGHQAAHAATAPDRSDELAVGSVATQADQMPQMLVGP